MSCKYDIKRVSLQKVVAVLIQTYNLLDARIYDTTCVVHLCKWMTILVLKEPSVFFINCTSTSEPQPQGDFQKKLARRLLSSK